MAPSQGSQVNIELNRKIFKRLILLYCMAKFDNIRNDPKGNCYRNS